jgi:hypothetical protein
MRGVSVIQCTPGENAGQTTPFRLQSLVGLLSTQMGMCLRSECPAAPIAFNAASALKCHHVNGPLRHTTGARALRLDPRA